MRNTFVLKLILRITAYVVILAGLFFVPAGTLAWPRAWLYLAVFYVVVVAAVIRLDRTDHDLLVERTKTPRQKGQPLADKIILSSFLAAYYGLMLFIPLDVFRFHLLPRPPWIVSSLGLVIYLTGWRIMYFSLRANPFAAPVVKLREERGQCQISLQMPPPIIESNATTSHITYSADPFQIDAGFATAGGHSVAG